MGNPSFARKSKLFAVLDRAGAEGQDLTVRGVGRKTTTILADFQYAEWRHILL